MSTATLNDYLSLTKPRLTRLVLLSAACGAALAPGHLNWFQWLITLFGTAGVVAAANTLNCYLERDVDAYMERTRDRPLVQGRLEPQAALNFGLTLAIISSVALGLATNWLTAFLGLMGFVLYVSVYTPLKRRSMTALFAGAIPGAIPPVMGWTAASNSIDAGAWILFGVLFFWQLPHFIAISLFRLNEYNAAGLKTVPGTLGEESARTHMLIYSAFLVFVSLMPVPLKLAGPLYAYTALFSGLFFAGLCVASYFKFKGLNWSRIVFWGSLAYLPLVLGIWVFDSA